MTSYKSSCSGYCTGRVTAFVSALLAHIKNPKNLIDTFKLKIITQNENIDIILSDEDRIQSGLLHTKDIDSLLSVNLNSIQGILFNCPVFLEADKKIAAVGDIVINPANISPPKDCFAIKNTKEKLLNAGVISAIKLPGNLIRNPIPVSVAEGMAVFKTSEYYVLIPYTSILELIYSKT